MTPAPSWQGAQTGQQGYEGAIEPVKKSSLGLWVTVSVLFIAVCGFTGMLAWEKFNQRVKMLSGDKGAGTSTANTGRPALPSAKADPMEHLNQKVLTGAAMAGAERLAAVLFNSSTTAERLKAIASPSRHQGEVAAMFDGTPASPRLIAVTPITNPPLSLATHQRIPMFKVVTSLNKSGALISTLTGDNGESAINWPLFRESHDGLLARHIEEKNRQPQWFHVGLRRVHSFDLPENFRDEFDSIDIDGSTDGSGHIVTYVAKESPLGRHLARNVEWGNFYFGRVLVSWMDIAGEMRPALLDCEGAGLPATP